MRLLKIVIEKLLDIFKKSQIKDQKTTIVLDTSALQSKKGMQIVETAERVVLLTGTIRELDKYKKDEGLLGTNIRIVSRKSREDVKQEKYICVNGYENSQYQDNNIIEYCKNNKKLVILTADNNLCNIAKAYNIEYLYVEPDIEVKHDIQETISEEPKIEERKQNIKGVFFKEGFLYLNKTSWMTNNFVYRDDQVIKINKEPIIKLEEGDIVFQIRYEEKGYVKVLKYEIEAIDDAGYAKYLTHFNMNSIETIKSKKDIIPQEVIYQILRRYSTIKVHNTDIKVSLMDSLVVRNGALIEKNYEYRKGDEVYKIVNVKSNKHLFIRRYEIIQNEDICELIEIDKYNIYFLNDIFRYHFPAPVEEEIRMAYLENVNY